MDFSFYTERRLWVQLWVMIRDEYHAVQLDILSDVAKFSLFTRCCIRFVFQWHINGSLFTVHHWIVFFLVFSNTHMPWDFFCWVFAWTKKQWSITKWSQWNELKKYELSSDQNPLHSRHDAIWYFFISRCEISLVKLIFLFEFEESLWIIIRQNIK